MCRRVRTDQIAETRPLSGPLGIDHLVNETFVRLLQQKKRWANRRHFFAIATRIMLRVLGDYHRSHARGKRAGVQIQLSLGALERRGVVNPPSVEIPLFALLLEQLEDLDPRAARVAKLAARL